MKKNPKHDIKKCSKPKHKKKRIIASLSNTGFGKTKQSIDMIIEDYNEDRVHGSRILYLLPDYENIRDVRARLEKKVEALDIDISVYTFGGKTHVSNDLRLLGITTQLCEAAHGKYSPGCKACTLYPTGDHAGCEYVAQLEHIKNVDVVFAVHHSAYLGLTHHFRKIIIDESLEGVLFKTFTLTEDEWRSKGIEWSNFPESEYRTCRRDCPLFQNCIQHREGYNCMQQSEIIRMTPIITRPSITDEEYFLHIIFSKRDVEVTGCWNFHGHGSPCVSVFNFLPELDCNEIYYNSATTSQTMINDWFFKNYNQRDWILTYDMDRPKYKNPLINFNYFGGNNQAVKGALGTILPNIREHLNIPIEHKGLIVVKLEFLELYKEKIKDPNIVFATYPLVGLDCYKDCDFVVLTQPFRYDLSTQYLMANRFGFQLVRDIINSYGIQAFGRSRSGDKPWLSNTKLLIAFYKFEHELFPNSTSFKEFKTIEWIKKILKSGNLSANKLLALTNGEPWFIERKRKTFLQYVKIAKKSGSQSS